MEQEPSHHRFVPRIQGDLTRFSHLLKRIARCAICIVEVRVIGAALFIDWRVENQAVEIRVLFGKINVFAAKNGKKLRAGQVTADRPYPSIEKLDGPEPQCTHELALAGKVMINGGRTHSHPASQVAHVYSLVAGRNDDPFGFFEDSIRKVGICCSCHGMSLLTALS